MGFLFSHHFLKTGGEVAKRVDPIGTFDLRLYCLPQCKELSFEILDILTVVGLYLDVK